MAEVSKDKPKIILTITKGFGKNIKVISSTHPVEVKEGK